MVDSFEILQSRIISAVKEDALPCGIPMQPYWGESKSRAKRTLFPASGQECIEVGYGGGRSWLGRLASKAMHVYWIKDKTVEPPVTYMMYSSHMGDYAVKGAATTEYPPMLYNVQSSDQGKAIISRMHQLLDDHMPPEPDRYDPSSSLVAGI